MKRLLLSFLLIIGLSGCGASPQEEQAPQQETQKATPDFEAANALVADITPFVRWMPGDPNITFDDSAARDAGLAEDRVELGLALTEVSRNATRYFAISGDRTDLLSSSLHTQDVAIDIAFSWLPSIAISTLQAYYVALGDSCPTPYQPPITTYATRAAAISRLTAVGYRATLNPTGLCALKGPTAYGQFGGDYTKPLSYSVYGSAFTPCYRYQGAVSTSQPWTFQVQGAPSGGTTGMREPNPEICEYTWPTWWWGAYAAYFHMVRC